MTPEARNLFTVSEVARLLHVSDDTVRRQIKEGDLEAIQIGTTPTGRPRYRIPSTVVEHKLSQTTTQLSALDRLREAFAPLSDQEKEDLIERAIEWARAQTPNEPDEMPRSPALTKEQIAQRLSPRAKKLLAQMRDQ